MAVNIKGKKPFLVKSVGNRGGRSHGWSHGNSLNALGTASENDQPKILHSVLRALMFLIHFGSRNLNRWTGCGRVLYYPRQLSAKREVLVGEKFN